MCAVRHKIRTDTKHSHSLFQLCGNKHIAKASSQNVLHFLFWGETLPTIAKLNPTFFGNGYSYENVLLTRRIIT